MKIFKNITELIGKTPIVEIKSLSQHYNSKIFGKLEYFNPLSSVKDRIALYMITDAEQKGKLKPGALLIEPTSGNTGIGLAYVAAAKGYKLFVTMPESMSLERRKLLQALGATLFLTPAEKGMKGAIAKAEELVKENKGSFMPSQFENPANPEAHRLTTAPEIIEDTNGDIDIFIAGVGTGGTITGCGEVLKKHNPNIKIIAVEPEESAVLSNSAPGPHRIQGIGAGFIPTILNQSIIDEIITVSSNEAIDMTKTIAKTDGLFLGISSGAALAATIKASEKYQGKTILAILPDNGERYLSSGIFDK